MTAIIVAYDENRGIGFQNDLPWKPIKEDWAHFKRTTQHKTVIMGRKTWDSLPKKPLMGRINVVISKSTPFIPDVIVCTSLEQAIDRLGKDSFIIGGATIYQQAIENNLVDTIIASEIIGKYECDTFFPKLPNYWIKEKTIPENGFSIVHYAK